jgi:hypothetical protein
MPQRIPHLFVNPCAHSNTDIPNIALAYTATHHNAPVVDLNTVPQPSSRYLDVDAETLGISFQSRSASDADRIRREYISRYPDARVVSLATAVDVQCCYPFLQWEQSIALTEPFSDAYQFPNYELFDSFGVFRVKWNSGAWPYAIMTSRGCPFSCTYCMSRNRKWFPRSAGNCAAELQQARDRWGIKSFTILDDCFNFRKDRVLEFCERVAPLNLEWFCTNGLRADRFDEEMAVALRAAGCSTVGFGIESSDPIVLESIKKGETIEQIECAVDIARRYFRSVAGFLIIGLPGSSYASDMRTLRWTLGKGIYPHFSLYLPFDETSATDATFYGDNVTPGGHAYPVAEQSKVYDLTRGLNWGGVNRDPWKVLANRLRLLMHFGPRVFLRYISMDFHKALLKLRRTLQ